MPKIAYRSINFKPATLATIAHANEIARDYLSQGYSLTLRQLYYRFVAADLIANRQTEYKRLGSILDDARYAGLFDWNLIEDRTRNIEGGFGGSESPADTIDPAFYARPWWKGQPERVEVWVEKDALKQVIGRAAGAFRVPYFSCRGYTSSSEIWRAARRIERYVDEGVRKVTILHLGDHDPSGIDMSRDIEDRLLTFLIGDGYLDRFNFELVRIALNRDQVDLYKPPPNPAKETDSRFAGYITVHGSKSWELDALEPRVLDALIQGEIAKLVNDDLMDEQKELEEAGEAELRAIKDHYDDIAGYLREQGWLDGAA